MEKFVVICISLDENQQKEEVIDNVEVIGIFKNLKGAEETVMKNQIEYISQFFEDADEKNGKSTNNFVDSYLFESLYYKNIKPYKDNYQMLSFFELNELYSYVSKLFFLYRTTVPLFYIRKK